MIHTDVTFSKSTECNVFPFDEIGVGSFFLLNGALYFKNGTTEAIRIEPLNCGRGVPKSFPEKFGVTPVDVEIKWRFK